MKYLPYILIVLVIFLSAGFYIDSTQLDGMSAKPQVSNNLTPAPEFVGISRWLNLPAEKAGPLTLNKLRGKVVLVDFWTYSCINCIRTLPYVTKWYDTYKDQGLVVIGVHTPEFEFEKLTENVERAIKRHGITYPVGQDNTFSTWNAYQNRYWPAKYLIDQNGQIVYTHFGEGKYEETENQIRNLLKINNSIISDPTPTTGQVNSPEMYLGTNRIENLSASQSTKATDFSFPQKLNLNEFALQGKWQFNSESVSCLENGCKLKLKFSAGKVHMVASSLLSVGLDITIDGNKQSSINISGSELYTLFSGNYGEHELILELKPTAVEKIQKNFFDIFTFTFG